MNPQEKTHCAGFDKRSAGMPFSATFRWHAHGALVISYGRMHASVSHKQNLLFGIHGSS